MKIYGDKIIQSQHRIHNHGNQRKKGKHYYHMVYFSIQLQSSNTIDTVMSKNDTITDKICQHYNGKAKINKKIKIPQYHQLRSHPNRQDPILGNHRHKHVAA